MLPEIHNAVREMLYAGGSISPFEVDVRFDPPTRDWIGRLTRPTLDLYLCEVQENTELRDTSMEVTRVGNRSEKRQRPRRIDLQYMVSALTTDIEDSYRLLWHALAALLSYAEIPAGALPEDLDLGGLPIRARVAQPDDKANLLDIWGGLGAEPRPALVYTLTVPLDLGKTVIAPLVTTRTIRATSALAPGAPPDRRDQIAGVVRTPEGEPIPHVVVSVEGRAHPGSRTDVDGRFMLFRVPEGPITLHIKNQDREMTRDVTVPADSYDLVLE